MYNFMSISLKALVVILLVCAVVLFAKISATLNPKYDSFEHPKLEFKLNFNDSAIKYYHGGFNFTLASQVQSGKLVYSFNKPLREWDISKEPVFDCLENRKELSLASRLLSIEGVAFVQLAEFDIWIIPTGTSNINLLERQASWIIWLYFREIQI